MKRRYIILLVSFLTVVGLILAAIGVVSYLDSNLKQLAGTRLIDVNLADIKDGVYPGSYSSFPITAEVEVTISGHAITGIKLVKHNHGQGAAAESIPDKVLEAQSLQVDTVSGATYSSKVILKAIEDALNQAKNNE